MKKTGLIYSSLSLSLLILSSCAPSASQMTALLENNPEILTKAIEKNPDKFMEAVNKAAQAAQGKAQENAQKEEQAKIEEEFKNPLKADIQESTPAIGVKTAPITIVEYTDFQCPFCSRGYQTMEAVRKAYGDKVRLVIKNLPLPMHPLAMPAAKRFEALMIQSPAKAFAYYHDVFTNQEKMGSGGEKFLDAAVKKAGGDLAKVKKDMDSDKVSEKIKADMAEAEKFGFSGTPGFIVEGVSVRGAYPFETFKNIIDRKLGGETKKI
jgi:protein-disulfide isomerase